MEANPGAAPEYSKQYLDASGGRSGLFEQLSQKTYSDFQHCAENLNYTARIENSWDIWRLIFYTIYFQEDILTTVPAACQQLVGDYGSSGQSEFLTALGADWWRQDPSPSNSPPLLLPDCSTNVECDLQQAAVALLQMQGSVLLITCQNQLVPSALCTASVSDFELACTEELDYAGSLNDLHAAVFDAYAINFGDIPPSCVLYAGIPLLTNEVVQATRAESKMGFPVQSIMLVARRLAVPPRIFPLRKCVHRIFNGPIRLLKRVRLLSWLNIWLLQHHGFLLAPCPVLVHNYWLQPRPQTQGAFIGNSWGRPYQSAE